MLIRIRQWIPIGLGLVDELAQHSAKCVTFRNHGNDEPAFLRMIATLSVIELPSQMQECDAPELALGDIHKEFIQIESDAGPDTSFKLAQLGNEAVFHIGLSKSAANLNRIFDVGAKPHIGNIEVTAAAFKAA